MALTEDHSGPDTTTQQSILQQARAAATAEDLPERSRRQETFLENTDLVTPDTAEDEVPPPAYGDVYGEIRNEKEGLGSTVARVANDGRVNIRINHLNRRLSQVFTPALQQHVQSVQVSQPPPPPYIPPGLGGKGGVAPPPPMNVVIQIVGSRGDVQPFIALGKVLKNTYGHRVRLATHPTFKHFVQENGLDFFSIGGDPSRLMAFVSSAVVRLATSHADGIADNLFLDSRWSRTPDSCRAFAAWQAEMLASKEKALLSIYKAAGGHATRPAMA